MSTEIKTSKHLFQGLDDWSRQDDRREVEIGSIFKSGFTDDAACGVPIVGIDDGNGIDDFGVIDGTGLEAVAFRKNLAGLHFRFSLFLGFNRTMICGKAVDLDGFFIDFIVSR